MIHIKEQVVNSGGSWRIIYWKTGDARRSNTPKPSRPRPATVNQVQKDTASNKTAIGDLDRQVASADEKAQDAGRKAQDAANAAAQANSAAQQAATSADSANSQAQQAFNTARTG